MTEHRCPECGTELAQATIDLADTPDVTENVDEPRAEFDPRHMAAVDFCPNPDCPSHRREGDVDADTGARL